MLAIFNIGPLEWIVLLCGAILLFGGDLPGVVRKAAQFLGRLRAMAGELSREVDLHDRYASPPQRRELPPPPELGVDPGAASGAASGAETAEPDEDGREAPERAADDGDASPPDHSDWEPESGSDRPRELRDDD